MQPCVYACMRVGVRNVYTLYIVDGQAKTVMLWQYKTYLTIHDDDCLASYNLHYVMQHAMHTPEFCSVAS
jgi:hypothetical protein